MNRLLELIFSNLKDLNITQYDNPTVPEDIYHPALILKLNVASDKLANKIIPKYVKEIFSYYMNKLKISIGLTYIMSRM